MRCADLEFKMNGIALFSPVGLSLLSVHIIVHRPLSQLQRRETNASTEVPIIPLPNCTLYIDVMTTFLESAYLNLYTAVCIFCVKVGYFNQCLLINQSISVLFYFILFVIIISLHIKSLLDF